MINKKYLYGLLKHYDRLFPNYYCLIICYNNIWTNKSNFYPEPNCFTRIKKHWQPVFNLHIIASALLGGAWMDLNILGENIKKIKDVLPFSHAIEASRIVLAERQDNILIHLLRVGIYAG